MINFKRTSAALLSGVITVSALAFNSSAEVGNVVIDGDSFPDAEFRRYVSLNCDKNQDGVLSSSEIQSVEYMDLRGWNINSIVGIKNFYCLNDLFCFAVNGLTSIDVSNMTSLQYLYCVGYDYEYFEQYGYENSQGYKLSSLDISGCKSLEDINCSNNCLTELNVDEFTDLHYLDCSGNKLTNLDISTNINLEYVNCSYNYDLGKLDVSSNKNLTAIGCSGCGLSSLDVSMLSELQDLSCSSNLLNSLDVSRNSRLYSLVCASNMLDSIDVSKNPLLSVLECEYNSISSIDVSQNSSLTYLSVAGNNLFSVDISNNPLLISYNCSECLLKSVDVSKQPYLTYLSCYNCGLSSLDLSNNPGLTDLLCGRNSLSSLNLEDIPKLVNLDISYNQFTSLDVHKLTGLTYLACDSNQITDLNIRGLKNLGTLFAQINPIKEINLYGCDQLIDTYFHGELKTIDYDNRNVYSYDYLLYIDPDDKVLCEGSIPEPNPMPTLTPSELSVGDFVNRCYNVALGREADEAGFDSWVSQLNEGRTCGSQVGYGFIFSGEYLNKNTDNTQYVKDLYSMFFGREADEAGFNYWLEQLDDGVTRENVFSGFCNSAEFSNLCNKYGVVSGCYFVDVPNDKQGYVNSFVARLYKVCLGRLPDQGGQLGWARKLIDGEETGSSAAYGFILSQEFCNLNLDSVNYVAYMYRVFFGREADNAGLEYWTSQLENGTSSRTDIFSGFADSTEFANLCASYGIKP